MSAKPSFASQLLFALGVLIVVVAIVAHLMDDLSRRYAVGAILIGLVFAFAAWRKMRR